MIQKGKNQNMTSYRTLGRSEANPQSKLYMRIGSSDYKYTIIQKPKRAKHITTDMRIEHYNKEFLQSEKHVYC